MGPTKLLYPALETERHVRLISLLPGNGDTQLEGRMTDASLDSLPPYECLSYAWGFPDVSHTMLVNGTVVGIRSNLSSALHSLRFPNTERVLWVDAICINQEDLLERNIQVNLMREVFTKASRVIVWVGVPDETSERAMKFLLQMGGRKKYYERHHWINNERQGSDTSSECGDGIKPTRWDEGVGARSRDASRLRGRSRNLVARLKGRFHPFVRKIRGWIQCWKRDVSSDDLSATYPSSEDLSSSYPSSEDPLTREPSIRDPSTRDPSSRVLSSMGPLSKDPLSKKPTSKDPSSKDPLSKKPTSKDPSSRDLILWKPQYVDPIVQPLNRKGGNQLWNDYIEDRRHNYAQFGHIRFGRPVLYENNLYEFFEEEWLEDWEALDAFLMRPWWSRTWVVQEVWSNQNAIIQCGSTTIKWKTFQKAMDYEEAWDDMGDMLHNTSREKRWADLKRRYSLAIHLSKKRLLDSTLSDLLWNTWDREVSDPRDKVFAMVGLVGKHRESLTKPDYAKSMSQVYREAARDIIVSQHNLDIFIAASGLSRRDGLPSWVPDWRREANDERPTLFVNRKRLFTMYWGGSIDKAIVHGHGYYASGASPPIVKVKDDLSTIHVKGICIGSVQALAKPYSESTSPTDLVSAARLLIQSFDQIALSEEQLSTTVSEVLTAGSVGRAANRNEILRNVMRKRRFFITDHGNMCIGHANTDSGDSIFIIAGCNFPMVLRRDKEQYALVGEAYVHDMMAGEVLKMPKHQNLAGGPKWQDIAIH